MAEAMIEVNKLSKLYLSGALFKKSKPAVRALDDVSIRLEKGKILGIVGESGSGKTTLANVILKLTKLLTCSTKYAHVFTNFLNRFD